MSALVRYEAARKALAEAHSVDEVKAIRDKAEAMRAYAKQAKDIEFANWAAEIKLRAERKAGELLAAREKAKGAAEAGTNRGATRSHDVTASSLSDIGITKSQSSRWQKVAAVPQKKFEGYINETTASGKELTSAGIRKLAKSEAKEKREARKNHVPGDLPAAGKRYHVIQADIRQIELGSESADCIITDPPYPKQHLETFSWLAEAAGRWLKPGGSLLVMSGQSYLPEVMSRLTSSKLTYHWTFAYLTPGGQSAQIWPRRVNTFWKPIIWLTKGQFDGDWVGDVCKSNVNDKNYHHWGQSESGMADVIGRVTKPGDLIVDPFCGGGTTGVVAVQMMRHFVGVDTDAKAVQTSRERLMEVANAAELVA